MNTTRVHTKQLLNLFKNKKVVTLSEMKKSLETKSTMTIFRKLKQLNYLSSCSHSGRYYTLKRIAKFNNDGLWFFNSILFSSYSSLSETIKALVDNSEQGYTAREIEKIIQVRPNGPLVELIIKKLICRKKLSGKYIYFSEIEAKKKRQELFRNDTVDMTKLTGLTPEVLMNELKAAIILFFCLLDERQRRLFAGLESIKIGHGGDVIIAELLDLNIKTVAKGRKELLSDTVCIDTVRHKGGGRKQAEKKNNEHCR